LYQWDGLVAWMRKASVMSNFDGKYSEKLSIENVSILKGNY
jgi:hypothetical protein